MANSSLLRIALPALSASSRSTLIEIRPAAGADGALPSSDGLSTLGPEHTCAMEIFEDRVFFPALVTIAAHL